jgi:outer membrane lipoprotein-sorting protein
MKYGPAVFLGVTAILAVGLVLVCGGCHSGNAGGGYGPSRAGKLPASQPSGPVDFASAAQVLTRVNEVYAACQSYRDTGVARVTTIGGGMSRQDSQPFATAFVRPDRFRFDFGGRGPRVGELWLRPVIWFDGTTVRAYSPGDGQPRTYPSVTAALLDADAASAGTSVLIPRLLAPDAMPGQGITSLLHPVVTGGEPVAGVECVKIEGRQNDVLVTILVGRQDFLIRQLAGARQIESGSTQTTINYQPELNPIIETELFELRPPGEPRQQ